MSNKYYIRSTRQEDFLAIVNLLQDISLFKPNLNDSNLIWSRFIEQKNVYTLVVIYKDDLYEEVVGYASLSTELKIRGGIMGHIEDVVIHDDHRKNGLGSLLINELLNYAKSVNCYKVSLECKENKITFYENSGFARTGVSMNYSLK